VLRPFGVMELVRRGRVAMARGSHNPSVNRAFDPAAAGPIADDVSDCSV
jgi:hypothetical protein